MKRLFCLHSWCWKPVTSTQKLPILSNWTWFCWLNVQLGNKVQWDSIGSFWVLETGFQHQEHMQHQCELLYVNFIVVEYAQESWFRPLRCLFGTIQNFGRLGYSTSWVDLKKCIPPKWRQYSQDQEWRGGSQCWWIQIAPSRLHCPLEIQSKSNYLLDGLNIQIRSCSENKYC